MTISVLGIEEAITCLPTACGPYLDGHGASPGNATKPWKGPGVFLLSGPLYFRESEVAEIFGVSERQVAAWHAAGLLPRQGPLPFPGGYAYRRKDVVSLANTPGPAATQLREHLHRDRSAEGKGSSLQATPESNPSPR